MTDTVVQFQGALIRLSNTVGTAVDRLVPRLGGLTQTEGLAFITDAYPTIVEPFISSAADITTQWYSEQEPLKVVSERLTKRQRAIAAAPFIPEPATLPDRRKLGASGRWALLQRNPVTALRGSATRSVFDSSRQTVRDNAERQGAQWTRHASANACGFCRMVATRILTEGPGSPGLYYSEGSADRNAHRRDIRGHDHCKCVARLVTSDYRIPDYVQDWTDDYYAVARDGKALRPEWDIAYRMEQRERERLGMPKPKRGRPPKPKVDAPAADNVADVTEAAARRDSGGRFAGNQYLIERNQAEAAAIARSVRDKIAAAQRIAARADDVVITAKTISGRVKKVTDFADKAIGGAVPIVSTIKTVVDAADTVLGSAAKVTGGANRVATLAQKTVTDVERIAQGAKQIADEVGSVVDDIAFAAAGARQLIIDAQAAAREANAEFGDVRGVRDLYNKSNAALETASRLQADGLELVDRINGAIATAKGIPTGIAEFPERLRAPFADAQKLSQTIKTAAADASTAAADAAAAARSVKSLIDDLAAYAAAGATDNYSRTSAWIYSERVSDELGNVIGGSLRAPKSLESVKPPEWVTSERIYLPAPPERLALPAGGTAEIPALTDTISLRQLPAAPDVKAIEAAPGKPASLTPSERTFDGVAAELNAAIELGDEDLMNSLIDELEALEAVELKKAERAAKALAKKQAADSEKSDRMFELIMQGVNEVDAEAEVYGRGVEFILRRNFMAEARKEGHVGRGFDELVTKVFNEKASEQYWQAETDTKGYWLKRKYMGKIDPAELWNVNEATARKWMSDEMAEWFDINGRITRQQLRESILSNNPVWRNQSVGDFLR